MKIKAMCESCKEETIQIIDAVIDIGPSPGEILAQAHCEGCGHSDVVQSWLIREND